MSGEVAKPLLKGTGTKQKPVFFGKLLQFRESGVMYVIKPHLIVGSVLYGNRKTGLNFNNKYSSCFYLIFSTLYCQHDGTLLLPVLYQQ